MLFAIIFHCPLDLIKSFVVNFRDRVTSGDGFRVGFLPFDDFVIANSEQFGEWRQCVSSGVLGSDSERRRLERATQPIGSRDKNAYLSGSRIVG